MESTLTIGAPAMAMAQHRQVEPQPESSATGQLLRLTQGESAAFGGPDMALPLERVPVGEVWARVRFLDGWRLSTVTGTEVSLDGSTWQSRCLIPEGEHLFQLRRGADQRTFSATVAAAPGYKRPSSKGWLTIGTATDSNLRLEGLGIEECHAEYRVESDGSVVVRDRSRAGTFVDGQSIIRARIPDGGTFVIGSRTIRNDHGVLVLAPRGRDAKGIPLMAAEHLEARYRPGAQALENVSFSLGQRELLAVVGPSGAGKSSLFKTLLGEVANVEGVLLVDGAPVRRIPYTQAALVPQFDALPSNLTIDQLLTAVMDLRAAKGRSALIKQQRIDEVLAQLELTDYRQKNVYKLSGGQMKRVSVALEILEAPSILLLDEPTSGLDEGLDRSLMIALSDLAKGVRSERGVEGEGSGVIIVTHSMANLEIADRVLALARGGTTSFLGEPDQLLPAYEAKRHADVMVELANQRLASGLIHHHFEHGSESPARVEKRWLNAFPLRSLIALEARRTFPWLPQESSKWFDRQLVRLTFPAVLNFLIIPLLIAGMAMIPTSSGLQPRTDDGLPNLSATIVMSVLTIFTALISTALTTGQFVKDGGFLKRLVRWRISTIAIVLARYAINGGIALGLGFFTGLLYVLIGSGPPDVGSIPGDAIVIVTMMLVSCSGAAVGLFISSTTGDIERAMYFMMMAAVAQVILSGLLIKMGDWSLLAIIPTWLLPTRWGAAALAAAVDLNALARDTPDDLWTSDVAHVLTDWLALALITLTALILAMGLLRIRLTRAD